MGNDAEKRPERAVLLPERHPNHDLFICDVLDAIPKDDFASMEHPVFSLATKPDTRILEYEHKGVKIKITPSMMGLATIYDKDVLIYCISQLMAKMNAGEPVSQHLHVTAHDLLVWTNRETSGDGYRRLKEAFERLRGTTITTNLKAGGEEIAEGFGLIDKWRVVRETNTGRMTEIRVSLSDWMFNVVRGREVLTLSRDYFRLRKPIERRVYEIARKHCGAQDQWEVGIDLLQKKTGASSHSRAFRAMIKELVEHDHLPDYSVELKDDKVIFTNREAKPVKVEEHRFPVLDPETYHDARLVAPGYDVYYLEREWHSFWLDSGKPLLHHPGKAFIAFCKERFRRNPTGR